MSLFEREPRIAAFEVAGPITLHAVTQSETLRTRRRSDRIGLDETEPTDRTRQGCGRKQAARDGVTSQLIDGDGGHYSIIGHLASSEFSPVTRWCRPR